MTVTKLQSIQKFAWLHPLASSIKLTVDDSSFGNSGRADLGGPICNVVGGWIYGFSRSCGRASDLMEELYVILKCLHLN